MRQLGDPRKTSVLRHVKRGIMRVARSFRLYDGKQGRAEDKRVIQEELAMACDCYQIGGPWIGADPNCEAHGTEAVAERKRQEDREAEKDARIEALEREVASLKERVAKLELRPISPPSTHYRHRGR